MSLAAVKLTPIEFPSSLMAVTSLAAISTFLTSLSPPYWLLIEPKASTICWMLAASLGDLAAHVTEPGRQCVGPPGQPVEIVHVAGDHRRPVGQPVTDEAGLVGGPELLRHHAQRVG